MSVARGAGELQVPWHWSARARTAEIGPTSRRRLGRRPAARADMVFAREPLAGICRERGIVFRELPDFFPVLEYAKARVLEHARTHAQVRP